MATLNFDGNTVPSEIIETTQATFSVSEDKLRLSGALSASAEAILNGDAKGSMEVKFGAVGEPGGNVGIHLRRSDVDNYIGILYGFSTEVFRIIKRESGVTTTLATVSQDTVNSYGAATITIDVSDENVFTASLDGQTPITATSAFNENVHTFSMRFDSTDHSADYIIYDVNGVVTETKTVTFDIPVNLQGKSDVEYWIAPVSGGASIAHGTLDTSSTSATFNLASVSSVTNGQSLVMFATDKATATTPYVGWDDADAVVTGA